MSKIQNRGKQPGFFKKGIEREEKKEMKGETKVQKKLKDKSVIKQDFIWILAKCIVKKKNLRQLERWESRILDGFKEYLCGAVGEITALRLCVSKRPYLLQIHTKYLWVKSSYLLSLLQNNKAGASK